MDKKSKKSKFNLLWKFRKWKKVQQIKIRWILRKINHHRSTDNEKALNLAVDAFKQFRFKDLRTGITLKYNLFIPNSYDPGKFYPLVLFLHDAGVTGRCSRITLIQGLGGIIWATPAEQAKHACFVLAPQFSAFITNDNYEASREVDATVHLVEAIASQYSIDKNRMYTTGQSMGCMASIAMLIKYPDVFAAALLVAGQWDAAKMSALTEANMWVILSEGDQRAFPEMNKSMLALEAAGAKISRATWNGKATPEEFATEVKKMVAEGNNIKYTVLSRGSVIPEGLSDEGASEHINTWPLVYTVEGLRDWLFSQSRATH